MAIESRNPATGELVRTYEAYDDDAVESRVAAAARAVEVLAGTTFAERASWARATADLLDAEVGDTAAMMVLEMGKTLAAAKAEVAKCAVGFRFYAEHAEAMLADEPVDAAAVKADRAFVRWQPLGVVLAVMPWNYPLWQAVRFAAPALMAGNAGLLKHASNVPACALYLEDVIRRGGFPDGAFSTLLVESGAVEGLLRDRRVAAATLTGSTAAGSAVAKVAGEEIKKTVLELGGSDPFVVLPSADLARAAEVATTARVQNNGQSCIAAKRFIVHSAVYDEFSALFAERMRALVVGDPMDAPTDVGPLATEQGRRDVQELLDDALAQGATVLVGGTAVEGPGWFFRPTLVEGVTRDARMWSEEVFGPVAQLHRVDDLDAAVELANATDFGLGSVVWTTDRAEQDEFVRRSAAGAVTVNGMTTSYPELPFGGIRTSGYGRELSALGIREFCNAKAVWVGP